MENGIMPVSRIDNVLVEPTGALTVRLLTVIVNGKSCAVVESIVTVFEFALVINVSESPRNGADPRDQFVATSHLPLAPLIQLFVVPASEIPMQGENSVMPLPVAVIN